MLVAAELAVAASFAVGLASEVGPYFAACLVLAALFAAAAVAHAAAAVSCTTETTASLVGCRLQSCILALAE